MNNSKTYLEEYYNDQKAQSRSNRREIINEIAKGVAFVVILTLFCTLFFGLAK